MLRLHYHALQLWWQLVSAGHSSPTLKKMEVPYFSERLASHSKKSSNLEPQISQKIMFSCYFMTLPDMPHLLSHICRLNDNSEFYMEDQWENNVFDSNVSNEGT
jgi:hypothetical protein